MAIISSANDLYSYLTKSAGLLNMDVLVNDPLCSLLVKFLSF